MKDSRLAARLREGHAARQQGRLEEALQHYRAAIELDPRSAEARTVCGLLLLLMDRVAEAEDPLRQAMALDPARAECRLNFARWLVHRGQLEEAAALVEGVVREQPSLWWARDRLGDIEARRGRFAEAAAHFAEAVRLRADDPALQFKWARACFDAGRPVEALRILESAGRLAPRQETILRLRTEIFQAMTEWVALSQAAREWIDVYPESWQAWRCLATAQLETGYLRQAMETYRKSLALGGRDANALATFGRLCLTAMEYESAGRAFEEAERLDPKNAHLLSGQAVLLMFMGRHEEAREHCRRALAVKPRDVDALKALVQLCGGKLQPEEFRALQALAADTTLRDEDRVTATFALADCLDAGGSTETAFATWQRANALARGRAGAQGVYDPAVRAAQTDELITLFDRVADAADAADGAQAPRPVFIVGMPRSGTTLIESVIGAHSQAFAGGERMAMRWILEEYLDERRRQPESAIPAETWQRWRDVYWRELPDLRGATVVTDKNPWNFDAIGLILRLFPQARIVHVRRDPVETAFSIFRNQFSRLTAFTHRLEDIAHYYGEYTRLMAHWERVAAGRFTTLQYEDFLRRFDAAAPALIAACGLEWEPACGRYWAANRMIATMSTVQARRPPGEPAGRAGAYAAELGPLKEALKAAGVDLVTGASLTIAERARSNTQP
jgi:Flp pilus assembly protein TadD